MKQSQINPYEHSDIKVKLLGLYIERYMNILSLATGISEVNVFDLFCGEGIYKNGKEGSPLIILKNIKEVFDKNKANGTNTCKFNFTLNDFDESKINNLRKHILDQQLHDSEFGSIEFLNKDYEKLKAEIIPTLNKKRARSFLFIDPYGYKNISITDIENFLSNKKTEVLLFLPTQFMYRFEKTATPDSLWKFMNELLPDEDWNPSKSGIDFINNLRDAFRQKLKHKHYVDSFIITRDSNQYFGMFFFTSHKYGFQKFLEAKWNIDEEEGRGWSPTTGNNNLFSLVESRPKTDKFDENFKKFLQSKRSNI